MSVTCDSKIYTVIYVDTPFKTFYSGYLDVTSETVNNIVVKYNETSYLSARKTNKGTLILAEDYSFVYKATVALFRDKKDFQSFKQEIKRKDFLIKQLEPKLKNLEKYSLTVLEKLNNTVKPH